MEEQPVYSVAQLRTMTEQIARASEAEDWAELSDLLIARDLCLRSCAEKVMSEEEKSEYLALMQVILLSNQRLEILIQAARETAANEIDCLQKGNRAPKTYRFG